MGDACCTANSATQASGVLPARRAFCRIASASDSVISIWRVVIAITSASLYRPVCRHSCKRVNNHAGCKFGVEKRRFLGHQFIGVAKVADGGQRGGLEEKPGTVLLAGAALAAQRSDFMGFVREGPTHLCALGDKVRGHNAVKYQVLQDRHVEL